MNVLTFPVPNVIGGTFFCTHIKYEGEIKMADREIKRIIASLNSVSEKKFYVYMLCDQKSIPFYIGKGEEKRVWSVFRICRYA